MKNSLFTLSSVTALLSVSLMAGCGDKAAQEPTTQQTGTSSTTESDQSHKIEGHAHGAGPHGGTIVDWGGGTYHVELTVDHDKQEATAYVLGSDENTPEPITAESILLTIKEPQMQLELMPAPSSGEAGGKSSRFVGTNDGLATVMEYEGTMSALVDGTPYAGNFNEGE
ncbi:hypothetical protein [Adhaeretor mobilis]|uniref:Lipoprotein n=1 Tax=Adhaeretor mobilis TaxID=1930276 RepID=A0A517MWK5_9BACT|nr:hypothetical protein [Adhaeretor mobilis]QDS99263.1 hypothetical protein HG15A2_25850 [Adhaeretor mobilis]